MLNILKNFFDKEVDDSKSQNNILELLCGLMIEAAYTDGKIDNEEINKIETVLIEIFEENPQEVKNCLNTSFENRDNSKSLFYYTSKINKQYSEKKKLLLIEVLWEIILSDGEIHDYESNLIRRLSGLLYVSDVNSGNAKKRALNKISDKL